MTERRWKVALVCLLLAGTGLAQAAITLPLPWKQGMKVRYQSESVQEKVRAGKNERTETRETIALEIAEAGDQGFLQVWRSQAPSVLVSGDGADIVAQRAIAKKMAERFATLPLNAELDAQGSYVGIRNWQELGAALREVTLPFMVQRARARPELAGTDPAKLREMFTPVLQRMTTREAINSALGKQVAIYNFFTGASLTPGKPVSYSDTMPSPWSADILPTVGSVELTEVNEQAGTITIRWKQSIDPVKGATAARNMVSAIVGAPLPGSVTAGLPKGLALSDQATVVLDRKSGLPLSLVHRREIKYGGNASVTAWTLKKLDEQGGK